MRFLGAVVLWLRAVLRRCRAERDMDLELRFPLERETELNVARGMSPKGARRAALVAFGGVAWSRDGRERPEFE